MSNRTIGAAAASLGLILGTGLSGCTVLPLPDVPDPAPIETTGASAPIPCLDALSYPGLPVWELNASLPVDGVTPEYVQYELGVTRGEDCTGGVRARAIPRDCPVWTASSEETVDVMLGSSPDAVTATEFARGSTAAITETVTGHASYGGSFQYRITAWQYETPEAASGSLVPDLVGSCDDAVYETVRGVDRATVYEGSEPHLVAYLSGSTAYLIESIRNVAPDGSMARIHDTASGLLPASAIDEIQRWWTSYGTTELTHVEEGERNT